MLMRNVRHTTTFTGDVITNRNPFVHVQRMRSLSQRLQRIPPVLSSIYSILESNYTRPLPVESSVSAGDFSSSSQQKKSSVT